MARDEAVTISLIDSGAAVGLREELTRRRAIASATGPVATPQLRSEIDAPPFGKPNAGAEQDAVIGGCALAADAGQALAHDPRAMAELDALPPGTLSSANAVVLWSGGWLDLDQQSAGIPLPETARTTAVRGVVEQVVVNSPTECREAVISGPQFVAVPAPNRTVIIVIGSGVWRWGDLTESSSVCAEANVVGCPDSIRGR